LKIPKRVFVAVFGELAVRRVEGGLGVGVVAWELGIGEQMLCNWVKAFDAGKRNRPGVKELTPEPMERS
jgi:transposase